MQGHRAGCLPVLQCQATWVRLAYLLSGGITLRCLLIDFQEGEVAGKTCIHHTHICTVSSSERHSNHAHSQGDTIYNITLTSPKCFWTKLNMQEYMQKKGEQQVTQSDRACSVGLLLI